MKKILTLSGSLRKASSSTAFMNAISSRMEGSVEISTFDISLLPHYNADIVDDENVANLTKAIEDASGLIIITPEYNYSIPGVLKNAIDWASRPAYNSVFKGKPVFVISVSAGALGGVRAQSHLKYILNGMLADVFPWQEIVVPKANAEMTDGVFKNQDILEFAMSGIDEFIGSFNSAE